MNRPDVEAIIADVFRSSGIKLTADDPIIAILLLQEARLKALFHEQRIAIEQSLSEHALQIEEPFSQAAEVANELKGYREQILTELLAKSNEQVTESERRIYASLEPKLKAQNKELVEAVAAKMNRSWAFAALIGFAVYFLLVKLF